MIDVVLLKLEHFVGRLLREKFNSNALVVQGDLTLLTDSFAGESVSHAARSIFIFLDSVDQLVPCLHINLSSFDDFL